jgi:beta-1,4-mannosyl-glycoprotein beta-1,4-N-acetylglucosaminyltransferase
MIWDCFTFFNELDLLDIRLHVLAPFVDKFVIVEGTKTHPGMPKPLYFDQYRHNFDEFASKIVYIVDDQMPGGPDYWVRENHQRNAIVQGLVGADLDDIILISDLDEIWRPSKLEEIAPTGISIFLQDLYCYYLNMRSSDKPYWPIGTRAVHLADLTCPQDVRDWGGHFRPLGNKYTIFNGGWHFSYLGGSERVKQKLVNTADQVYDTRALKTLMGKDIKPGRRVPFVADYLKLDKIQQRIDRGDDVTGMSAHTWQKTVIDESYPDYIRENQCKLARFIR